MKVVAPNDFSIEMLLITIGYLMEKISIHLTGFFSPF